MPPPWIYRLVPAVAAPSFVLAALVVFSASIEASKWALLLGLVFALPSTHDFRGIDDTRSLPLLWAERLLSFVSTGLLLFSAYNLVLHPGSRWVHRFVIYGGYFLVVRVMALLAHYYWTRFPTAVPWRRIGGLFLALHLVGSLAIYLAKEYTVRQHAQATGEAAPE